MSGWGPKLVWLDSEEMITVVKGSNLFAAIFFLLTNYSVEGKEQKHVSCRAVLQNIHCTNTFVRDCRSWNLKASPEKSVCLCPLFFHLHQPENICSFQVAPWSGADSWSWFEKSSSLYCFIFTATFLTDTDLHFQKRISFVLLLVHPAGNQA